MKYIVLISLCSIIYFSSCTKKATVTHNPIDSFLVQNFNYRPGTYWIYKDSVTGEEDSFFVSKNTFSSIPNANSNSSVFDEISINIFQYHLNSKIAQWQMYLSYSEIDINYIGNIEIDYSFFILIPYKIGLLGYNDKDSGYVISINNSYIINSNAYNGVVIMKHINNRDTVFPQHNNTFYFNSDVGIIKMALNQDIHNIWELERSKIIK